MEIIEKAAKIAVRAHDGQTRKEGDTPYIVHPIAVALILARHGFGEDIQAAALVHDVAEDTSMSLDDIRHELGEGVALLVAPITHDDSLSWEEKKKAYVESVRNASAEVKAIATADKIANAKSLIENHLREGSEIWNYFNAGKEKKIWFEKMMLEMLSESWDHPLVDEYRDLVDKISSLE